jgi:hypothetical protein
MKRSVEERNAMDDDQARETLLRETIIRALALRDVVAVLLALQARASGDADALFREVSSGLDERLAALNVTEPHLVPHLEGIRGEVDRVVEIARRAIGEV